MQGKDFRLGWFGLQKVGVESRGRRARPKGLPQRMGPGYGVPFLELP